MAGLALLGVAVWAWQSRRETSFRLGLAWFLAGFMILPAASLLQPANGLMIEPHWFIFSSAGIFIALAALLSKFKDKGRVVLCVCLAVWMAGGWRMNYIWADEKRYGDYWHAQSPAFLTLSYHMARIYEQGHDSARAQYYYEFALNHHWRLERVTPALGWMYLQQGRYPQAKRMLMAAVYFDPGSAPMWTNLGVVYYKEGDWANAKMCYDKAVAADPKFMPPQLNLQKMKRDGRI